MQGYDLVFRLSLVAGLSFIYVGEILGNVDNDIHARFKHKKPLQVTVISNSLGFTEVKLLKVDIICMYSASEQKMVSNGQHIRPCQNFFLCQRVQIFHKKCACKIFQ